MYEFCIRGTRGTTPACCPNFLKYGGSTTCFSLKVNDGLIIVDAGTGISRLGTEILQQSNTPPITLLFTHFHLDHVSGLPTFELLYRKKAKIRIMADPRRKADWRESLKTLMGEPFWPIGLGEADADMELVDIPVHLDNMDIYGVKVEWFSVPHPQQCLSYKFTFKGQSVVIATDLEYTPENLDDNFIKFCKGADYLIFDAHYTPAEYPSHKGWGHSTWETAVAAAKAAEINNLLLTHHAPSRQDSDIDIMIWEARNEFPRTDAASENMILDLS